MSENDWFVMRPQKAQAYGRPESGGFLVRKDSTAMREGSPRVKRDREERDRLVRRGVLVPDSDPDLYRFRAITSLAAPVWPGASSRMETAVDPKAGAGPVMERRSRKQSANRFVRGDRVKG